jgi:hypothetical protein
MILAALQLLGITAAADTPANISAAPILTGQVDGLKTFAFTMPSGSVEVSLPDDMSAGDTISGTVIAYPSANSAEELADNVNKLNGHVLSLAKVKPLQSKHGWHAAASKEASSSTLKMSIISTGPQGFSCIVPASEKHLQFVLSSEDQSGDGIHEVLLASSAPREGESEKLKLPTSGECAKPIRIKGQFDGNSAHCHVTVGGHTCTVLAESPRQLIFLCPATVTGRTKLEIHTGGKTYSGKFDNRPDSSDTAVMDLRGGWSGTGGPITINQSGHFVTWDTGSIKYWGVVGKDSLDFEFHNYRYESRGKGHLTRIHPLDFKMYLEGYYYKTWEGSKRVDYPKHVCHLYRM